MISPWSRLRDKCEATATKRFLIHGPANVQIGLEDMYKIAAQVSLYERMLLADADTFSIILPHSRQMYHKGRVPPHLRWTHDNANGIASAKGLLSPSRKGPLKFPYILRRLMPHSPCRCLASVAVQKCCSGSLPTRNLRLSGPKPSAASPPPPACGAQRQQEAQQSLEHIQPTLRPLPPGHISSLRWSLYTLFLPLSRRRRQQRCTLSVARANLLCFPASWLLRLWWLPCSVLSIYLCQTRYLFVITLTTLLL